MLLNKERGSGSSRNREFEELQQHCIQLERELELVSSAPARAAALKQDRKDSPDRDRDIRKELSTATKQVLLMMIHIRM